MARKNDKGAEQLVDDVLGTPNLGTDPIQEAHDQANGHRMDKARAGRKQKRAQRTPRLLYLIEAMPDGNPRVLHTFPNKYRLAKWLVVAETILPGIRDRVDVIKGRAYKLTEVI